MFTGASVNGGCLTQGCIRDASTGSRGWCSRCYTAWLAYGDPSLPISMNSMFSTHPPEAWDLLAPPGKNYETSERWEARYPGKDPMRIAQIMLRLLECGSCGHEQPFLAPQKPKVCECGRPAQTRGKCPVCYGKALRGHDFFFDELMPAEPCTLCGTASWNVA